MDRRVTVGTTRRSWGVFIFEIDLPRTTLASSSSGILFLYRGVLRQEVGAVELLPRAQMPSKVPVVLTVAEVRKVLDALTAVPRIVAVLLYGAGLRLQECLELRVKDLDFERREIYTHVLNRGGLGVKSPMDRW